jgi:hypothetical protein
MRDLMTTDPIGAALVPSSEEERQRDLALTDEKLREMYKAGDPAVFRALKAQVDDFVDSDPFLRDLQQQLQRGTGPAALVMKGMASWAPVRGAGDWSDWGDWEVWEECEIGQVTPEAIGAKPTGGWLIWHAPSGQQFGFARTATDARKKAEMMAVVQNAGKPTRVVLANGDAAASELVFGEVAAQVGAEVERIKKLSG